MKHLGHYVRPGAVRLGTSEGEQLAVCNPDGSTVLLANPTAAPRTLKLALGPRQITVAVAAHSFNTFRWQL